MKWVLVMALVHIWSSDIYESHPIAFYEDYETCERAAKTLTDKIGVKYFCANKVVEIKR